jgi:hypothetical protein
MKCHGGSFAVACDVSRVELEGFDAEGDWQP